jgi:aspartyl-tRNA(Asn)/glutamyl-tRNA(Gln) amidotransferase subunit A
MHRFSAHMFRTAFLKGDLSAEAIVNETLKRIHLLDGTLGAFLCTLSERTKEHAKQLDDKRRQGKPLGKLAGVPIAIKDNIHIKGQITTCASQFLKHYKAPFSATAVDLLEAEDALLIGKTNLDEFAMGSSTENSAYQITKNPWDLKKSPGGSSGGSAAAVAARFCPIALGSDTGGSIRQPAALTGIVGFKPTYGRVSRFGLVAFGSSFDQIGPLTRTVEDAALAMEVLGRHCAQDSTSLPAPPEEYSKLLQKDIRGSRIGVPWKQLESLEGDVKKAFLTSIDLFKELGAEIVPIDLDLIQYSIALYYILATAEASTNLARFDGIRYGERSKKAHTLDEVYRLSKQEGFGPEVKKRILLGTYVLSAGYQDAFYKKAQKVRTLVIKSFKAAHTLCDIIALPTAPSAAFDLGSFQDPLQMYLQDIFTIAPNLTGAPAISIPNGFNAEGLPLGLQLIGPQLCDGRVLQHAYAFTQKMPLYNRIPSLFDTEATL